MYQLTMLAVPHLINSRGNIVNVSSVNGIRPVSWCCTHLSVDGVAFCNNKPRTGGKYSNFENTQVFETKQLKMFFLFNF